MSNATHPHLIGITHGRCGSLRCKEMFFEEDPDVALRTSGSGIYWCSLTQTCLGPDSEVANPQDCKPGRGCYEAL